MKRLKLTTVGVLSAVKRSATASRTRYLPDAGSQTQQYIETLLAGSRAAVVVTDRVQVGCWRWFPRLVMTQTCL